MTKKRKRYPTLDQKLERPWCYYCERDFDDLKILISHQKAKHFKCDRCGRRLNTAGGLSVHMNQVHKENLTHVENANPGRQGLEIEIFGMEGVPQEILEQHTTQVTQTHFAEAQERARLTGNPMTGMYGNEKQGASKRPRVNETLEEIESRATQYRIDRKNGVLPMQVDPVSNPTPPIAQPPHAAPPYGAPGGFQQGFSNPPAPFANGGALPPRPGFAPPVLPPGQDPSTLSNSIDDLIGEVTKEATPADKKEEKMAALPRYAEFARS
jgi:hypothetical protein